MQIPAGLLADRLGPRRSLTFGLLAMGLGELLFAVSPSIAPALAGRALVDFPGQAGADWVVGDQVDVGAKAVHQMSEQAGVPEP